MATGSVQIAKLAGATKVMGSTGDLNKKANLLDLGFDHVGDYKDPASLGAIRQFTNSMGVDMVWEIVGTQQMFDFANRSIRLGGTMVPVGAYGAGCAALQGRIRLTA